ncbi:MAG TPA: hypothetical protein VFT30_08720, partial [Nitrospira sp.]|nr:hypothetical protein [Nitrospira sp.]
MLHSVKDLDFDSEVVSHLLVSVLAEAIRFADHWRFLHILLISSTVIRFIAHLGKLLLCIGRFLPT